MLELINIKKDYKLKDQEPVHALKGINLNFRSHEFVAILGHSGCGKTTLLNITGGLDHYDDGDLLIKGKSTKDFKSRDWDTYRNHSIGFVFQTYNLIPHQTILKNVELALTISGVKKEERTNRAKAALDSVGLEGLYRKKPNQLSGGQMQRVAIARALVNNPEIVLADEPTGALDSETSVQIMDLLQEVAKTHLVIMVTHNPELAEKYATRIVRMKDGLITDDTNPFDGKEEIVEQAEEVQVSKGRKKNSSMSFLTAGALSVSNLLSKFKRTLLVSIAGSIGIIGVSTILGVSCGVNNYIGDMQDDMLSSYPITVAEESLDMTSLLTGLTNDDKANAKNFDTTNRIGMDSMIRYLLTKYTDFTNLKTNDMSKELLAYIKSMPQEYYSAINVDYSIDPTNNIFTAFKREKDDPTQLLSINGLTQQYIATLGTVDGFNEYMQFVDIFTSFMKQLPGESDYILSQYDLIRGSFPTKEDELLLVVDDKTTLTDLIFAQMGYYPQDQFLNIAKKAVKENEYNKILDDPKSTKEQKDEAREKLKTLDTDYPYDPDFSYDDVMNHEFIYYPHDAIYTTEDELGLVSHKTVTTNLNGKLVMGSTINFSFYLALSYIPSDDMLTGNLIVIDSSDESLVFSTPAVFERDRSYVFPEGKTKNSVIDGKWDLPKAYSNTGLSVTLFSKEGTKVEPYDETRTMNFELDSGLLEMSNVKFGNITYPYVPVSLDKGTTIEIEPETPDFFYRSKLEYDGRDQDKYLHPESYPKDTASKTYENHGFKMKIAGILRPKSTTNFGSLNRGVYFTKAFGEAYRKQAMESTIVDAFKDHLTSGRYTLSQFNAYVTFEYVSYKEDQDVGKLTNWYASALNGDLSNSLMSIFASFLSTGSDNFDDDALHLRSLSGLKAKRTAPADDPKPTDPTKYTYTIDELPQSISIYPRSFETKDKVTEYLDYWNSPDTITINVEGTPVTRTRDERVTLTYTDTISLIVEVISTLVTTVSAALIAFTSLSLVVSCFMIAVITYISVMERVKEIGVIRSLGGRKRDVSRLFIAENLVTGFASGAIGIGVTYIIQAIINAIVKSYGITGICALPWYYALMMVGIAVVLSVISGLIPSLSASKQDPVIALRSE